MTDHLQTAKDLMGLVDALTGGPVDPEKAMAAAQTHAMIAIAEALRSGTIERTETVQHVWDAPESPRTASEPEQAPAVTPEPVGPPCRKCGLDERDCEGDVMGCCAECSHPSGRWEWVADDEVVVRLRPGYSDHTLRDAAKGLEALGWPLAAFALEALADGIDRKGDTEDLR